MKAAQLKIPTQIFRVEMFRDRCEYEACVTSHTEASHMDSHCVHLTTNNFFFLNESMELASVNMNPPKTRLT